VVVIVVVVVPVAPVVVVGSEVVGAVGDVVVEAGLVVVVVGADSVGGFVCVKARTPSTTTNPRKSSHDQRMETSPRLDHGRVFLARAGRLGSDLNPQRPCLLGITP
jgi:hypothetical protein